MTCWPYSAEHALRRVAVKIEGQAGVILNSARDPEARRDLVANASANGVALILRIREMAGELRIPQRGVVAQKQAARHRKPRIADRIGIAQEARKSVPVGQIDFRFRAINDGFAECNREADGRVIDLIVIRIVGHQPPEIVGVQLDLP